MYEAKTQLSKLIELALDGEEVTIAKAGKPQVRLVPVSTDADKKIVIGGLKGKVVMADNFDDPLPEFEPYV